MEYKFCEASRDGKVSKMKEILRSNPALDVNWAHPVEGKLTALHYASLGVQEFSVGILLAHPDIDVNKTNVCGCTPFMLACEFGSRHCVRLLLKDARVRVDSPDKDGCTPLWRAAFRGRFDTIMSWIASGREMNLGEPGNQETDVIEAAKRSDIWDNKETRRGKSLVVELLERYRETPEKTRHQTRIETGWYDETASQVYAIVVFVSDGLLGLGLGLDDMVVIPAARFILMATKLPLELQAVLSYRVAGSGRDIIVSRKSEVAFKTLAKSLSTRPEESGA